MRLAVQSSGVWLALLLPVLGAAGACGGDDDSGQPQAETVTWCQAREVLEAKCQRCHFGPPGANGASFPLVSYEDTQADLGGQPRWMRMEQVVDSDFMPPSFFPNLMPPVEKLEPREKHRLLSWLEQGAEPVGGEDCP